MKLVSWGRKRKEVNGLYKVNRINRTTVPGTKTCYSKKTYLAPCSPGRPPPHIPSPQRPSAPTARPNPSTTPRFCPRGRARVLQFIPSPATTCTSSPSVKRKIGRAAARAAGASLLLPLGPGTRVGLQSPVPNLDRPCRQLSLRCAIDVESSVCAAPASLDLSSV